MVSLEIKYLKSCSSFALDILILLLWTVFSFFYVYCKFYHNKVSLKPPSIKATAIKPYRTYIIGYNQIFEIIFKVTHRNEKKKRVGHIYNFAEKPIKFF